MRLFLLSVFVASLVYADIVCPPGSSPGFAGGGCACADDTYAVLPDWSGCGPNDNSIFSDTLGDSGELVCNDGLVYNPFIPSSSDPNVGTCADDCTVDGTDVGLLVNSNSVCVTVCPPDSPFVDLDGYGCTHDCAEVFARADTTIMKCVCDNSKKLYLNTNTDAGSICSSVGDDGCAVLFGVTCLANVSGCPGNSMPGGGVTPDSLSAALPKTFIPVGSATADWFTPRKLALAALVFERRAVGTPIPLLVTPTVAASTADASILGRVFNFSVLLSSIVDCLKLGSNGFSNACTGVFTDAALGQRIQFVSGSMIPFSLPATFQSALVTALTAAVTSSGNPDFGPVDRAANSTGVRDYIGLSNLMPVLWAAASLTLGAKPAFTDIATLFGAHHGYSVCPIGQLYLQTSVSAVANDSYASIAVRELNMESAGATLSETVYYLQAASWIKTLVQPNNSTGTPSNGGLMVDVLSSGYVSLYSNFLPDGPVSSSSVCVCPTNMFPGITGSGCEEQSDATCPVTVKVNGEYVCACSSGQRWSDTDAMCISSECGVGQVADTVGECSLCSKGESSRIGGDVCFGCPLGTWSTGNGGACQTCAPGTVRPEYSYDAGARLAGCIKCSVYWHTILGNDMADIYPLVSSADGTACLRADCLTGTYGSSLTDCTDCPSGSISGDNATQCTPCDDGYYTHINFDDVLVCVPAPPGTYVASTGDSVIKCDPGTYSTGIATSCTKCALGTYADKSGARICKSCPDGQYADSVGSQGCSPCPFNSVSTISGDDCIKDCPGGTRGTSVLSGVTSARCEACVPGSWSSDSGRYETCQLCRPGTYAPTAYMTSCLNCSAGNTSGTGSAVCAPCPAGYYIDHEDGSCRPCEHGSYSPFGSLGCSLCPRGTYAPYLGASACTNCPRGSYMPYDGSFGCIMCPEGRFVTDEGAVDCPVCPVGTTRPFYDLLGCADETGAYIVEFTDVDRANQNNDATESQRVTAKIAIGSIFGAIFVVLVVLVVIIVVKVAKRPSSSAFRTM